MFVCKTAPDLTSQVYRSQEATWTLAGKLQAAVDAFSGDKGGTIKGA